MTTPLRRISAGAAGLAAVLAATTLSPTALSPAQAASPDLLLAEVYGGGGNSGATLTQDFVELGNRGAGSVGVDGLSVQYLSASPGTSTQWSVTPLRGSVAAGGRYLVAQAKGSGGTVELPAPDATGTTAMSGTSGTVALVRGTDALTCKTAADCAAETRVVDLVGYGAAVVREGAAAGGTGNTTSAARRGSPLAPDTDDNDTDFAVGAPTPTNSSGQTSGGGTPPPAPATAQISEVQGTTRVSPLVDRRVGGVEGVVTAVRAFGSARGFWFTDPTPDTDPRTSEGLFVFTGSTTPAVAVGDAVSVTGTVAEFYPSGGAASSVYQSTTQLTGATWTVTSSGNPLPAPLVITPTTVPDRLSAQPGGSIEPLALEPAAYSLDFWEAHEGETVSVSDARVVGPTTEFNELYLTTKPQQNPTVRGGTVYLGYDRPNTGVLKVESLIPFSQRAFPVVDTGDVLTGVTSGPVEYDSFGGYTLQATALGAVQDNGLVRETTRRQRPDELAVATYNVENLSPVDAQAKFDELARGIVDHLASPDIVTLEEIQDDNGPTNDAVVSADETLRRFTDAIAAAGGPRYSWRQIDPQDDRDGGQPGGNIRVAFLFDPERVSFTDRPGGDATTAVGVVRERGKAALTVSPGRIEPTSSAWDSSRKPLVGEFRFHGRTVFVVANHFNSKGGDQPTHGRNQPPVRSSETQRLAQAGLVHDFVDRVRAVDRKADVVVAGDLNDYQFSPALQRLTEGGALVDLIETLPPAERYSYVFEGNSQVLDHILVTPTFGRVDYDVVHINAEFADQASDHDPQVVRLRP